MKIILKYECLDCGHTWIDEWEDFCPQCESEMTSIVTRNK